MYAILKRNQILVFFILTFVISWIPWYAGQGGFLPIGVSLAGLITAALFAGRAGLSQMFRSLGRWRAGLRWYAIALLLPAGITLAAIGLNTLLGGKAPGFPLLKESRSMLPLLFLMLLFPTAGPVGEEITGWRGYAQPRLQDRFGPVGVSVLIGAVWGVWHLPEFFRAGSSQYAMGLGMLFPLVIMEVAHSTIITWVYNRTNGSSLLGGVLVHFAFDFSAAIFLTECTFSSAGDACPPIPNQLTLLMMAVMALVAVLLILATRGRLGLAWPAKTAVDPLTPVGLY